MKWLLSMYYRICLGGTSLLTGGAVRVEIGRVLDRKLGRNIIYKNLWNRLRKKYLVYWEPQARDQSNMCSKRVGQSNSRA